MPIKGISDGSALGAGLPRIATLYKGAEKPEDGRRPGADLDYFRVEFEPQYEHLRPLWEELYGPKPTQFERVYLTAGTVEEAFSSWKEEWNASQTLLHRCDGEHQVQWYNADIHMQMRAKIACVSPANEHGIVEKPQCGCKSTGRLNMMLPEFIELTGAFGYVTVTTHSLNDILTVYRYLSDIQRMYSTLTGIPFVFGRAKKEVSAPKTSKTGERTGRIKVTKSLFFLHVSGEFAQQRLLPVLSGAMSAPALPAPVPALPTIDVEKAKNRLGNGNHKRRMGASAGTNGEEKTTWIDTPERLSKFLEVALQRYELDEGYVLVAFENAASYPVEQLTDWREDEMTSLAAIVAFYCEYDVNDIEHTTASGGYDFKVFEAAEAIAKRMNTEVEAV
jgi:hypothetical protein